MLSRNRLKQVAKWLSIALAVAGLLFLFSGTADASALTLKQLSDNFDKTLGDVLQIVLYVVTALAICFCFMGFNHLRMHHNEPQAKHMGKAFVHMIVALGFLSGAPLLHMLQNSLLDGVKEGVVSWDMNGFNGNISPENSGGGDNSY